MVLIFHDGGQPVKISLEELKSKTPAEVIENITKSAPDCNTYLTHRGVKFANEKPLASAKLVEDDFLRIVQMIVPSTSNIPSKDEIEAIRRKLYDEYKVLTNNNRSFAIVYNQILNYLVDPNFYQQSIQQFPELKEQPNALAYLAEPLLLLTILKDSPNNRLFCQKNPGLLSVVKTLFERADREKRYDDVQLNQDIAAQMRAALNQPLAQQPVITADFLQQAINFAMGNVNNIAPAQALAPQADPLAQARLNYAQQLEQMRECGFLNDELSLTVLMQTEGNVATAMEILIEDSLANQ